MCLSCCLQARRRKRDELAKAADELYQRLQLYAHGAESVQDDEATFTALQKHIQRSIGHAVLDLILRFIEVIQSPATSFLASALLLPNLVSLNRLDFYEPRF